MFSVQSLLVGNGTSVTCVLKSREPITALNVATYVTPLMVRNFWLCALRFGNELNKELCSKFSLIYLYKSSTITRSLGKV